MATNNKELAASIVELLGGSSNISTALHCVTRLRFNLRDDSLAKLDDIRQLKGVLGAQIKDGQYQVIIGPNVNRVYDEVVPLLDSSAAADKPSSAGKVKRALRCWTSSPASSPPFCPPWWQAVCSRVCWLWLRSLA